MCRKIYLKICMVHIIIFVHYRKIERTPKYVFRTVKWLLMTFSLIMYIAFNLKYILFMFYFTEYITNFFVLEAWIEIEICAMCYYAWLEIRIQIFLIFTCISFWSQNAYLLISCMYIVAAIVWYVSVRNFHFNMNLVSFKISILSININTALLVR